MPIFRCGRAICAIAAPVLVGLAVAPDHVGAESSSSPTIGILLAAGDIARCESDGTPNGRPKETAALITKQINDAPAGVPVRVVVLGDLAYENGEPKSFSECFGVAWGSFKDKMLPVPGNHEYRAKLPDGTRPKPGSNAAKKATKHAKPYFDYFQGNALVQQNGDQKGYYSINFPDETSGPWQLIGLNPYVVGGDPKIGLRNDSEQMAFVRKALDDAKHLPCVLAFAHPPRFSSGVHGHGDDKDAEDAEKEAEEALRPLFHELYQRKASLFLAGHDHHFEQLGPVDADGIARHHGVRSFVVGTGGAGLYSTDYADTWPFREAYNLYQHGVLKIELKLDSYSWSFLPVVKTTSGDKIATKGGMKVIKNVTGAVCNRVKP